MAVKYDAQLAIATAFSTQGGTLIGFEIQGLLEEGDEILHVEDADAQYWGIYARIQDADGPAALAHWIADINQHAQAQAFCDILNQIQADLTTPKVLSDFIHPLIQAGLESLDDQQPYNYKIEQTSTQPENFELYIWEADADQTYNYETKEDAENDIRMAAKYYHLELIDYSALPSHG